MSRKRLLPWLFSLLFLLAQQGLWLHALSHHEAAPGGGPVCEQCLAFATVSGVAPAMHPPQVASFAGAPVHFAATAETVLLFAPLPFSARAPPFTS